MIWEHLKFCVFVDIWTFKISNYSKYIGVIIVLPAVCGGVVIFLLTEGDKCFARVNRRILN